LSHAIPLTFLLIPMETQAETFKPWYVWPNPAIHFRLWYESANCRIFIIENISHNWEWLSKFRSGIRETDYFIVSLGWHFHYQFVQHSRECLISLGIDLAKFKIMCNSFADLSYFTRAGFDARLINQNCFLDYNRFKPSDANKEYDAIYIARFVSFKRHYLASQVKNLALVAGSAWGKESGDIPSHTYLNSKHLDFESVLKKICASRVGLILSEAEGACYSSSEYLLSGIPVVSTPSYGGRDIWYNEMNSIICEPTPSGVAQSVANLIKKNISPSFIRDHHIALSDTMRQNFINLHQQICYQVGEEKIDCKSYFQQHFFHKLIRSETPDFERLFPQ
jgi:glycosyltransferase involved in cell wall biosynthesis